MRKFSFRFVLQWGKGGFLLLFALLFLTSPAATFHGAQRGLELWAFTLVPALLPFVIFSHLLLHSGFITYFGRLLDPFMRPLFHLSGSCAFAVALGFTSGFPMGAIASAQLVEQNLCTKKEAARLVAFTNNSSPLFLLASVPISMLHTPQLGALFLLSHYGANLLLGIVLGQIARIRKEPILTLTYCSHTEALPLMKLVTGAIEKGIASMLNIGGFVVVFSVIIALGDAYGCFSLLASYLATSFSYDQAAITGVLFGLIEITLGADVISASTLPLLEKALLISFVLAFSGLCIHAQVIGLLNGISPRLYLLCRPLQGILAVAFVYLLWPYQWSLPAFTSFPLWTPTFSYLQAGKLFCLWLLILFFGTLLFLCINRFLSHIRQS